MNRHSFILALLTVWVAAPALPGLAGTTPPQERPNILWLIVEDMSPHFSCYGERTIRTPHVDRLAAQGIQFNHAFVTAPICSIARSALITGRYQTSIGAHHHRSGRGELTIQLSKPVVPILTFFQQAGYQTLNLNINEFLRSDTEVARQPEVRVAKTDYNFEWDPTLYDRVHWTKRTAGQPFFAQIQLRGGKLRGHGNTERWPQRVQETLGTRTPASAVQLPPYLPDDPVIREDWAQYLDTVRYTDWEVGQILDRLREAGELERTWIFLLTDHGISHVRNKQFLYEGGIHVPLIVYGPQVQSGTVRQDLVEHIDLAASSLALAGIPIPDWMHAQDILASDYRPRDYVFAARDRADETVDWMRCVRGKRHKYIRNFLPLRPYLQPNNYKDNKPIIQTMRQLYAAGKLDPAQALIMREVRPPEELYDLSEDPFELHNLAEQAAHQETLQQLRNKLQAWQESTHDGGLESEARYDSDMAAYLKGKSGPAGDSIRRNIAQMKTWAREGQ